MQKSGIKVVVAVLTALLVTTASYAGGPLFIFEPTGAPIVWDTNGVFSPFPVPFNPDQGGLGNLTNAEAVAFTQELFQTWEDIPTSSIAYQNAGQLVVDVATPSDFFATISNPFITPIIFDEDGSLFAALGFPPGVIGFAGANFLNFDGTDGFIFNGLAALNGAFLDGNPANGELSINQMKAAFFHEFGHLSGLDHSQVNGIKFFIPSDNPGNPVQPLDPASVETMFPFLTTGEGRTPHTDDIAHISALYPAAGATSIFSPDGINRFTPPNAGKGGRGSFTDRGAIMGNIYFSDGMTPLQGINVIARNVDDPFNDAVAFVSGSLFSGNQFSVDFGFPDVGPSDLIGFYVLNNLTPGARYKVEIEEINSAFTGGSSVGPQSPPLNIIPGGGGFIRLDSFNNRESGSSLTDQPTSANAVAVHAGRAVGGIDLLINDIGPDPNEPNDNFGAATAASVGFLSSGTIIHPTGDVDYYTFTLTQATDVVITTLPFTTGAVSDTTLGLFDNGGVLLAVDDDSGLGTLSQITETLSPGTYFVAVATFPDFSFDKTIDADNTSIGFYRLSITSQ